MKRLQIVYLDSISANEINNTEDIISDERLLKHLWLELILNPEIVVRLKPYAENIKIKKAIIDALSWYLAFRWIFPENTSLENTYKYGGAVPYKITARIYRQKNREFLKGLLHAGLC
ncbi:MAG: hypothetical protein HZA08_06660 [Nitrospirae bacterium]|nr:hypothetical protein [Nitrospirota bacterium]